MKSIQKAEKESIDKGLKSIEKALTNIEKAPKTIKKTLWKKH